MNINELRKELRALDGNNVYSQGVNYYFQFYGLDLAAEHLFGTFKSEEFTLAAHIFRPKEYKATAIIIHGYTMHCGLLSKLIKYLAEADFAVAVFDLPGHGLSSGKPTAIDDFTQYSDCLNDFMKIIIPHLQGPYHIIGHSTGAAIILDYLLSDREDCFDKVILAAPLERSDWWLLSKIGFLICRIFCNNLPRVFRKISSDKEFLKFLKYQDPLSAKSFSLKWAGAMFEWDDKIEGKNSGKVLPGLTNKDKELNRPMLIIQGTKDNIVNWRYNIRFILSKFKNSRIELIENARHELFNESQQYRDEVFSLIKDYLTK